MRKFFLTKICVMMLLAVFSTAWSSNAWALTINVKASQEPYVYAWDNAQNPLLDAYPGTKLTNTKSVGGQTWYYIDIDATNVNLILSFGTDDTKTGDITNITGTRYFEFANNNANNVTDYYDTPNGVSYHSNPFTYVVNASNWSGELYAYAWGNGYSGNASTWPGKKMTKVGTNGNGNDVYEWVSDSQTAPANVIFNNNSGSQTSDLTWANGAYWSNYGNDSRLTISGVILNSTNFPDANLRAAITASTGIQEGEAITINNIKVLDISNHGITNTTGIAYLTELEELYANNNDITFVDLQNATNLRILDLHQNENLLGFGVGNPGTSNHIVRLPSGCLQYIDMSKTRLRNYTAAAFAEKVAGTLETFIARDVYYTSDVAKFAFNSVPSVTTLTKLKYIDVSGCDGTPVTIIADLANMKPTLEYLDISNQHMTTTGADPALDGFTALKTFKFNTQATWTNALSINNCPALTYIDVSGNVKMTGLTINNCGITSLNFPEATTLSTLAHLATLDVSNNPFTVLNIPQTPNTLLTVTANDCSTMTRVLAEHNASKLQFVTAHNCPALTDITINGADIYFNKQLNAFDATNKSTLVTLDLSNDAMSTNYALDGFTALQTVDFDNNYMTGNNNNLHSFTAINCPALTTVNLNGNANMQTVTLTNNSFSNSSYPVVTVDAQASNVILDFSNNNFTAVPNIQANQINVLKLNDNQLTDINIPDGCSVNYLYAQNNNFQAGDYTLPQTSLVGLDLGNNGFTKFKAENNTSLKSLALAGNTGLTEIELHGNTALTQTSPDGVIESDNGLYIKGLSSLQTLNIENSSFNKLGQQNSLQGVTGLTKLQARHNEFTTFTNGVYNLDVAGHANYRVADPNESSLEYLVNLEYLDLAYNNLQDSVHLYRNVNLKHLDVSHNNEIHGVYDGTIDINDAAALEAMRVKKGYNYMKYGRVYGKDPNTPNAKPMPGWNPSAAEWTAGYTNLQALRERPFDLRIEDLNDTTGLYHLDLGKNVNLEWLDFSYTNIHNTSAGPTHMNPGWMDTDWVTDMGTFAGKPSSNTTTHRAYVSWHTFVYFIPCTKLQVIHADHNNMRSLGVRYFPELDTLTCSYMYGDSEIMRDFNGSGDLRYGMGNTGTQTSIKKFQSVDWDNLDSDGYPTIVLVGPNGTTASTDVFPNKLRYWDLSYSGYNEVRLYPGSAPDLPYLEYLDVSGNPLNFTNHASHANYATTSNWNSLDVTYCPNIRTVKAENCSDLPIVRAHNRPVLDTLYLSNDPKLKALYIQNDPVLKDNFVGLSTLTGLETMFAYNNTQFGGIDVTNNTALKNLWVSNINAEAIDVSHNTALEKLRIYDNSLTSLSVASNPALTWLDFARNSIEDIDLSANTALQYLNCSNSEETLNDQSLAANNHNGGDADNVKPVTVDNKVGNNSLSDLVIYGTAIADVRANNNDLHCIKPGTNGSFANLTNIEFAHNHINGISLPSGATVNSEDNGRDIVADCAKFTPHGDFGNVVTVYFFQLENVQGNGTQLTMKTSEDSKGATRVLGTDGLVLDNINWNQGNSAVLTANAGGKNVTLDPNNMAQYLNPDDVPGTIVVLEATNETDNGADGQATYTYNTGNGDGSTFYLNWSSDGAITGINSVIGDNGFDLAGTYGGIVVAGKDGTVVGVYDTNGRQIASETISGGKLTIDGLSPGIYIVNGNKVLVK
ncbi:MAG: starch-binding protein [Muribaculaceae bacterium]|nr:starch-binding protein [Muribaculaceae bacterium]